MSRALRRDDGFTMIELLLVCVISLIVFGATLTAWTSIYRSNRALEGQQDNAEAARVALDRAARQLRNLANPTVSAIKTIEVADDYDFIFQTSDPAKTWVRYCLQTSGDGTSPSNATLWEHENKAGTPINAGMMAGCPNKNWTQTTAVVQGVTNTTGGIDRNVFEYECSVKEASTCPASSDEFPKITNVGMHLWVDAKEGDRVSEMQVSTGVFLRNQNEGPTAVGSWSKIAKEKALLNGAGSSDPEGRTLEYFWFEGTPPTAAQIAATPCTAVPPNVAWQGVTFLKRFDPGSSGPPAQSKTFYLLVRDPGCLTSLSSAITFQVPS
jgi:prepilin-type N-terminal cleavage/methylation domain-containing protein